MNKPVLMKNVFNKLLIISVVILGSCEELVHTQQQSPRITLSKTTIDANGSDLIEIKAELDRLLAPQQRIKFTTTNGLLFSQPISNGSSGNKDSILVKANDKIAIAYLRASQIQDSSVIISASIGTLVDTAKVVFKVSCPTQILVSQFNSTISNNETIEIELELLRDDAKKVSTNQRIDCSATPSDAVEITPIIYSSAEGKAKITLKALKTGTVTLNFTDRSTCARTILPKTITIN
jgi:hypothetical protein